MLVKLSIYRMILPYYYRTKVRIQSSHKNNNLVYYVMYNDMKYALHEYFLLKESSFLYPTMSMKRKILSLCFNI